MFKVGDKAYVHYGSFRESYAEVTITSISPKRGDISVVYSDKKKDVFDKNGWARGRSAWGSARLIEITPELEEKVFKLKNIRYVKTLLDSFVKYQEVDIEDILMLKQVIKTTNWFKNRKSE